MRDLFGKDAFRSDVSRVPPRLAECIRCADLTAPTQLSEIMVADVVCVDPETSAARVREALLALGQEIAVVVDSERRPLGVSTMRDLVLPVEPELEGDGGEDPSGIYAQTVDGIRYSLGSGFHIEAPEPVQIADVMTEPNATLLATDTIATAAGVMVRQGSNHVVVTDRDGVVVGVVSATGIARWLSGRAEHPLPRITMSDMSFDGPVEPTRRSSPPPGIRRGEALRKTVLVVEDDEDICDGLIDLLEDEGFVAIRAANGRDALAVLKTLSNQPGLILLDLMMPEMNGWEFRKAQLCDPRLRPIPVVVLTALGKPATQESLTSPAAILTKPVAVDVLMNTVQQHFQLLN